MNDFRAYLKQKELSKTTVETYYYYLMNFLSFLDSDNTEVENCTAKEIMSYLNHLKKNKLSTKSRQMNLTAIKHFFDYLVENKRIISNPAKRIKLRGAKQNHLYNLFTQSELQALNANYNLPKTNETLNKKRNKIALTLLINQGITTAEVSRILIENISLRKAEIEIIESRKTSGRILKLKSHQIIDLMEYMHRTRIEILKYHKANPKELLLNIPLKNTKEKQSKISRTSFRSLTLSLRKQNKKFINFKQIRASVITHWLKQQNLRQVQYMAGHRYISSTERYQINDIEDLKKEIENYHPM